MAELLVVDDDPDLRSLAAELLSAEGHRVRLARDGLDGLAQVSRRPPDLAVLDVEMPNLTGPEMSYLMFAHNCGQEDVPVVLVSGVPNLPAVAAQVGTPYYLAKPYQVEQLLALVARALREHQPPHPAVPA